MAIPKKMVAIDYNMWASIIYTISSRLPLVSGDYGLSGVVVDIAPSYPNDLSRFVKPSIIIQKVTSDNGSIGFGNVLGQYHDDADNATYDVNGVLHGATLQADVNCNDNIQCEVLSSALIEGVLLAPILHADGYIPLMDFVADPNNPVEIGTIMIDHDLDITNLSSNKNNDYIKAVRFDISTIRTIFLTDDMVDLSKGIKLNQTIKL